MQYAGIAFVSQIMYTFKTVIEKGVSYVHVLFPLIQRIGNNGEKQYSHVGDPKLLHFSISMYLFL